MSAYPESHSRQAVGENLGRRSFSESITSLIRSAPVGSSFRIGIYGGWGEGKTSAMRFVEGYLPDDEYACIRFDPIGAQSVSELKRRLFEEIAKKLGLRLTSLSSKALTL